jgi:hypothetical protein
MGKGFTILPLAALALTACAAEHHPPAPPDARSHVTGVQLATLEIRDDQVDRFEHCPPAGEIGQAWIPVLPEWHPPAASAAASVPESAVGGSSVTDAQTPTTVAEPQPEASLATLVDQAATATRASFRHCYHHGLMLDPTQDGHVAVVLRVGRTGKVASVETWGACDLAPETLSCMRDEASRLSLVPPAGGSATVTVPAVFTTGDERRRGRNDGYAAAAYVAVEAMRPRLHACEEEAKRAHESVFATADMRVHVDGKGRAVSVALDRWTGGRELALCAVQTLRDATFPPPPAGQGLVIVPIAFNPRPGSR